MLVVSMLKDRAKHKGAILVLDQYLILLKDLLYHSLHQWWRAELSHPLYDPAAVLMLAVFNDVTFNLVY